MRYDSCQFGPWDGLDNRRELMILFQRLGAGLPEVLANERRAVFIRSLMDHSESGMKRLPIRVDPCGPVEAYNLTVAVCGCLQVPIDKAARMLDNVVKCQKT